MKRVSPAIMFYWVMFLFLGCKTAYFTNEIYTPMDPVPSERKEEITILFFGEGQHGSDGFIRIYHWYAPYSIYISYRPVNHLIIESVYIHALSFHADGFSLNLADCFRFPYLMERKEEKDGVDYNWTPNNLINKGFYPVELPFSPDLVLKCDIEIEVLYCNGDKERLNQTLIYKAVKTKRFRIVPIW